MPARDIYHDTVKNALIKDGWTITQDPLFLKWGSKDFFVDLGAERMLAAEKDSSRIAVEVKSFAGTSEIAELERGVGQFLIYRGALEQEQPERVLYLAIPQTIHQTIFEEPVGKYLLANFALRLLVFDPRTEVLVQWIP